MNTQQLIRSIDSEFDEMEKNHGWIPEHKERIKSFILAKLSQVLESVEKEIEGEKQNVVFMSKSDPVVQEAMLMVGALNQGLDRAITLLKEARDAAGSNTGGV